MVVAAFRVQLPEQTDFTQHILRAHMHPKLGLESIILKATLNGELNALIMV